MPSAKSKFRSKWIHLLPLLHLCACFAIILGNFESAWEYLIFYIDYPISVFVVSALYSFDHPLILFGIMGTLWWYLLSWLAITWGGRLIGGARKRRYSSTAENPK